MKLIEALGDMEEATREDKKKIRSMEENVVKEREKVLEQINKTVNEVIILSFPNLQMQSKSDDRLMFRKRSTRTCRLSSLRRGTTLSS